MSKKLQLIPPALILVCTAQVAALAQAKPLVTEWVNEDIQGVSAVVQLLPFENQNIEKVKVGLRKDWHVEETDLGLGAKYLELEKGQGYSMGYVHALIYNGRVAQYEAGIQSYSDEWPRIRQRISDEWRNRKGPEISAEEHGIVFRQTLASVLQEYKTKVAATLGEVKSTRVPPELATKYASLTDPMNNSTLSGTRRDDEIDALLNSSRVDLLENVLRAYNPGARVLAAFALLELEKSGTELSTETLRVIDKVLNLSIKLHACVFDMCNYLTAQEALRWFDSGLAFPKPKPVNRSHRPLAANPMLRGDSLLHTVLELSRYDRNIRTQARS